MNSHIKNATSQVSDAFAYSMTKVETELYLFFLLCHIYHQFLVIY